LIRYEIIALDIANKQQFYPECAHLAVTGNGTETQGEEYVASIPGGYSIDCRSLFSDRMLLIGFRTGDQF
jgi:hypothetical protein